MDLFIERQLEQSSIVVQTLRPVNRCGQFSEWKPYQTVDPFLSLAGAPNEHKLFDRSRDRNRFAQ
jgi:hypothetical protein